MKTCSSSESQGQKRPISRPNGRWADGSDYATLKFILANMIISQVNQYTYLDFTYLNYEEILADGGEKIDAYEPETLMEMIGFTNKEFIKSLDF